VTAAEAEGEVRSDEDLEDLDAEAQARRRLALAQIRQWGDPVLRMRAAEVEEFNEDLRCLAVRMVNLMRDAQGVGLAGTQVGILRRIFVFQTDAEDEPTAVVNPELAERSDELETDQEGCLSLQGVHVPVERNVRVTVVGRDPDGEELRLELEGLEARVAQHEVDHLDGTLIVDRTDREHRREALGILRPPPLLGLG
jgi:peptide deformylase